MRDFLKVTKAGFNLFDIASDGAGFFQDALGYFDDVRITITSQTGDWFAAASMHNSLASHRGNKHVTINGLAAGPSVLIAMAADEIEIPSNSMMAVSSPCGMASGEAEAIISQGEAFIALKNETVSIFAKRTGQSAKTIQSMMDNETWIPADRAIALGFADRMIEPQQMVAKINRSLFRNAPPPEQLSKMTSEVSTASRWQALEARAWRQWNKRRIVVS